MKESDFGKIKKAYEKFAFDAATRRQFKRGFRHMIEGIIQKHSLSHDKVGVYSAILKSLEERKSLNPALVSKFRSGAYAKAMQERIGEERLRVFSQVSKSRGLFYKLFDENYFDELVQIFNSSDTRAEKESMAMQLVDKLITDEKSRLTTDPALLREFEGEENLLGEVISDWALVERAAGQDLVRQGRRLIRTGQ